MEQCIQRQVFDDMKACYGSDAFSSHALQVNDGVIFNYFETACPTSINHNAILFYAVSFNVRLPKELQPFAATGTDIYERSVMQSFGLFEVRQINLEALLDVFVAATKSIFKRNVHRIQPVCFC